MTESAATRGCERTTRSSVTVTTTFPTNGSAVSEGDGDVPGEADGEGEADAEGLAVGEGVGLGPAA
jgi:hypothetical protein